MLTTVQMVILVVTVIIAGAVCGLVLSIIENNKKREFSYNKIDLSLNSTYGKMRNSDISVDDIIDDFKLLK